MFQEVKDADFVRGEHDVLKLWAEQDTFKELRRKNAGKPRWNFLDGPITANNPMGVHHAWGRTYKDCYQRYFAMTGHDLRYQNGFDCQGLWVEVEVEKQLGLGTKTAINEYGIDKFVNECKRRVLTFAARQTEQSVRLGYWMDWDDPEQLRMLAGKVGSDEVVSITAPSGKQESGKAHELVARLGNSEWGGSYFTFSTENNETIWTFLKKCFTRGKVYRGYDVMPWSGRSGSAYSQMEINDGRKLAVHRSCFVRLPIVGRSMGFHPVQSSQTDADTNAAANNAHGMESHATEYILIWTTTPWTLTSNVAAAINPDLDYVKLRSKRDGAIYYFAKDNLEFQRLATEFKEGFGRPEWKWPSDVPKLKTLSQIFKEQGGYEIDGTIKGAEMIGWQYAGPFDDLPAQNAEGGVPEELHLKPKTGVTCHRVIDGGRDFKGNANVVAGEGTGIVHIAPGCGDIDHQLGKAAGIVGIAPLGEDGNFLPGFGEFTGRSSIDPATADLVFKRLEERGMLVAVEKYPHIYPHCWRTGDELVFRLVDEWFINMDWRQEIIDVVQQIRWLPDSIDGQANETQWLTSMRDWMISKKRFWGLALPIWVNPEDHTDFEVIGSLAELKERAVEGWSELEGNTPHRPWIDAVKIKSQKTGAVLTRIQDVGNPWLDAGIVPFSTQDYRSNKQRWSELYPADLVTECFPGQFRNWFYALLSMSTMMRYDEATEAVDKRPFKTLLGHRLVMNEEGKPMHKSDGTAIWFEEAAEQLGVDTMRWMYLTQNPAQDLRFGTRHKDKPVTLETPEGPRSKTKEGVDCCTVTSKPADEVRRRVLIPLWNSYAFFVNYARLDEFDPTPVVASLRDANPASERLGYIPVAERPEIDRWILSNLQNLLVVADKELPNFNAPEFCRVAEAFIDDLTNWYIRRNRRRFWRSKDASDTDKTAAYQTLYEVLVTLTKALAPLIPFLTERMYQNLVGQGGSVHLCDYPKPDLALLDPELNAATATAQVVVKLGHKIREEKNLRVRLPLAEVRVACFDAAQRASVGRLADVIQDELNIKTLTVVESLDDLVKYSFKPNLKTLGPKYGKLLNVIKNGLASIDGALLTPLRRGESVSVTFDGNPVTLAPEDVMISTEQSTEWACADEGPLQVAIATKTTPELEREGAARDFIRQVQQLRKEADLQIQDRIAVSCHSEDSELQAAITEWSTTIQGETLADSITWATSAPSDLKLVIVGQSKAAIWIMKQC